MSEYKLSQLNIYPVKSLPGFSLKESFVEERGLKYDRRWMLTDSENRFITQRLFPKMIFIAVKIKNSELIFFHARKNIEPLKISLTDIPLNNQYVEIWEDLCIANEYNKEVNQWFSEAMDFKCKLFFMPNSTERKTSTKYFFKSKNVSFADGYPFLILGEEAINYLNTKLSNSITINNFRPNLVFSGGLAHDEDNWVNIKIGNLDFSVVKPCARCVITTIDSNGNKNKEPLATLSSYRNFNNKIMFGQNALVHSEGIIKIGDSIIVE